MVGVGDKKSDSDNAQQSEQQDSNGIQRCNEKEWYMKYHSLKKMRRQSGKLRKGKQLWRFRYCLPLGRLLEVKRANRMDAPTTGGEQCEILGRRSGL